MTAWFLEFVAWGGDGQPWISFYLVTLLVWILLFSGGANREDGP